MKRKITAILVIVFLLLVSVTFFLNPDNKFATTGTTDQTNSPTTEQTNPATTGTGALIKSTAQNEGQLIIDLVRAIKKSFE